MEQVTALPPATVEVPKLEKHKRMPQDHVVDTRLWLRSKKSQIESQKMIAELVRKMLYCELKIISNDCKIRSMARKEGVQLAKTPRVRQSSGVRRRRCDGDRANEPARVFRFAVVHLMFKIFAAMGEQPDPYLVELEYAIRNRYAMPPVPSRPQQQVLPRAEVPRG